MQDNASAVFEAHATRYADDLRRQLIPPFDAFYGTAVAALADAGAPLARVLDLGAGTGLLAGTVAAAYPAAHVVLVDGAPAMLEQARQRLGGAVGSAEFHVADLRDPFPTAPDGTPYDAIVSALAIHHLDDGGKRDLFARAFAALRPGGVFVNAEQVIGRTDAITARYRAWHESTSKSLGVTDEQWEAAEERMSHDRCATVEDQLEWLARAGFDDPDAPMRDHRFAVIVARKPT
ncbi:trans-aconitate 2-methyltransferase [Conexibacter sp. CPCC 206217]|uniref:class I SAM-dependent methyltransferase n=1 Tax=Conexibacter sp. CPCC 206217 TaxID=3064574 RepID=UPI002725BEA6|nr:class I SAM-dependent methyltransferase [Conexibacter sp. CPCC 206217]MDO8210888.1 class I SAM-dependent methyltransferase [Conexibacter sp. CPCC 206217]